MPNVCTSSTPTNDAAQNCKCCSMRTHSINGIRRAGVPLSTHRPCWHAQANMTPQTRNFRGSKTRRGDAHSLRYPASHSAPVPISAGTSGLADREAEGAQPQRSVSCTVKQRRIRARNAKERDFISECVGSVRRLATGLWHS